MLCFAASLLLQAGWSSPQIPCSDRNTKAVPCLIQHVQWSHLSCHLSVLAAGEGISGESSLAAEIHAGVGSMQPLEEGLKASHMAGRGQQVPLLAVVLLVMHLHIHLQLLWMGDLPVDG